MNRNSYRLEWRVIIDVIYMGQRQDARVTAGAAQAASRFSGVEVSLEQMGRESTRPLIEITEYEARRCVSRAMTHNVKQFPRLVASLEVAGSQVHIEDSQTMSGFFCEF